MAHIARSIAVTNKTRVPDFWKAFSSQWHLQHGKKRIIFIQIFGYIYEYEDYIEHTKIKAANVGMSKIKPVITIQIGMNG